MTIYDDEQRLSERMDAVLRQIRNDGYTPTLGVDYNEIIRELNDVRDRITALECESD